jgi:methyl-accepting chemotaxis protein
VHEGFDVIQNSLFKMEEIKGANADTIIEVKTLSKEINSIWDIVNMITDIADQTKIIAFNAELQASSAGEAGRNFRIVASEIRRLADSTVRATNRIKSKIQAVQKSSDRLIMTSEDDTLKITEGWELSQNLKTVFEQVQDSADVSNRAADQIALSIKQQASAFEQILQTLKQISEGIEQFAASTKATTDASTQLKGLAHNLHAVIDNFVGHPDAVVENTGNEGEHA